jgi:type IV pilus assembly protein PilA
VSRKQHGFTLIELMIVVAIIGILAAIAIPNFLKFQCKSKQSEAKTNLSGIFTAEKAFFGEYNTYGTDLISVNWKPDGTPLYVYGFQSADWPTSGSVPGINGYAGARKHTAHTGVQAGTPPPFSTAKMIDLAAGAALGTGDLGTTTMTGGGFTAAAAGDIDTDSAKAVDLWYIDEVKNLRVQSNDCTT